MCLSIMTAICTKQHLSNFWSSIHEKVKQHWGWAEKSVAYKKACISSTVVIFLVTDSQLINSNE